MSDSRDGGPSGRGDTAPGATGTGEAGPDEAGTGEARPGEADARVSDYAALFDLAPRHTLHPARGARVRRGDTLHETRWLEERDAARRLVARYRTWTNRSSVPPYRTQLGWERFSPAGELLVREVRYSTRESVARLH